MKYIFYIILVIVLFMFYENHKYNYPIETHERDTLYIRDTVTITEPIERTRETIRYERDTIYTTDSIKVETDICIEGITYTDDSTYYIGISGYKAKLDTFSFIGRETIINETTFQYKPKKQPKIQIKPSVGIGYGAFHKKLDVYVGASLVINF